MLSGLSLSDGRFFVVFRLLPFIRERKRCVGDTHSYFPHTQCGGGPVHGVSETRNRKRGCVSRAQKIADAPPR